MNKVLTNMYQGLSALEKQIARRNIGAENASNRVTSIDENSTDDQYPSAKCVFDALQDVGGGYKDGGALVDADFIKVENNTVSSYDNESRDPVNFYFEPKDGEVLNAVIELTNDVNATVNVYYVVNGIYYLLGNVGGNTVNAGEDYRVNITGNSYSIEQVTGNPETPVMAKIGGGLYSIMKHNNLLWMASDLKGSIGSYRTDGGRYYYSANKFVIDGWRVPTKAEFTSIYSDLGLSALKSDSGWPAGYDGTNSSGFDMKPNGYFNGNTLNDYGNSAWIAYLDIDNKVKTTRTVNESFTFYGAFDNWYVSYRLVKEL